MPSVHVCSLSQLDATVASSRASHLISVINADTAFTRPAPIAAENHLFVGINDIAEVRDGLIHPEERHVSELIAFIEAWDRDRPLVVHCFAGISRSTAAAYIALCAVQPGRDEGDLARQLREASPVATPNPLIVAHGDTLLGRDGRMIAAISGIGRGADAFEGTPFAVPVAG